MNCDLFIEKLPEMIENEVSGQDRQEMFEHMKYCKSCRDEFQLMMTFREELKGSFIDESLKYESRKHCIMSKIDKNKYKNAKKKLIYKVSVGFMAASVALAIVWTSFNKIIFKKENLEVKSISSQEQTPNKEKDAEMSKKQPVKKTLEIIEAKKGDNEPISVSRGIINFSEDIKNKIDKNGDSLLPLKDTVLKQQKQWVGPPRIEYMNNNIMIVTAANYIGAYSFKENAYYSIVDLKPLNVGEYQGSQVYDVQYINDRCIAIGTVGEHEANDKPIYIVDLVEDKAIELKDFSLNNSRIESDTVPNSVIIAKNDFSKIISLDYKDGQYKDVNGSELSSYNYSTFDLEKNEVIKQSIYNDKKLYPGVKSDDKLIALYKNRLFIQRGNAIYVISKDMDKLLVENLHEVKFINSCDFEEKIVIEEEKETIIINKSTLEIFKYKGDMRKATEVKYSPKGTYRVIYNNTVIVEDINGSRKEFNDMSDYVLGSKITDEGKLIYLTLDETVGVKVNIKDLK